MKTVLVAMVAVAPAGGFARADDKAVQEEKKKLEGNWIPQSAEIDGKKQSDDQKPPKIEFKGDRFSGLGGDMTFTIDPFKKPKHLDLTFKVNEKEITWPCIYELDGNELRICLPLTEKDKPLNLKRPVNFETKGIPVMLFGFKRAK